MCKECSGGSYSPDEAKESAELWQYYMSAEGWNMSHTAGRDEFYPFDTACQRKIWKTHYGHKGRERMPFKFSTRSLMRQQENALERIKKGYDDGGMPDGAKLYRIAKELLRRQVNALRGEQ